MKFIKDNIFFILIIAIGLLLRIYNLSSLPGSLNPDEAAIGYTSYSLFISGADEHGKVLPLTTQSFGDWKLPLYSYLNILPIAIFGLNEFSVRFVSVFSGVVGIIAIYFVSKILFNRKSIALISALFFAVSPWSIYFSRAAYEVNLATTLFLIGLLFFAKYVYENQKKAILLVISFVMFLTTMLSYHSYILFTPIFAFCLLIFFRKTIFNNKLSFLYVSMFIFLCLFFVYSASLGSNKLSTLIFNDENIIYSRVEKLRGDSVQKNEFFEKILHNKYLGVSYQIGQNYLNSFSPGFLFDKGGEKLIHNIGAIGHLYLIDSLFLIVGFASLFLNRERSIKILLFWIIIGPISSAITRDAPNSTRLFVLMPFFILISSYGLYNFFKFLKKKSLVNLLLKTGLVILFIGNILLFIDAYFVHFNVQRVRFWHYGYKQVVELTEKYKDYNVVMRGPENFPYIYFLFYEKYDPVKFRKEVVYYPYTFEGFLYVKKFGKYQFVDKIDYSNLKKRTLYIDDTRLDDKKNSIFLLSGEPIFGYYIKK